MILSYIAASVIVANMFAKTYGWSGNDWAYQIAQTNDGGFVLQGSTISIGAGDPQVLVMRLAPDGTPLWTRVYGFSANDWGTGLCIASDGNIISASESAVYDQGDILITKLSIADGSVMWSRLYRGLDWDGPRRIIPTPDGGFTFISWTESLTGEDDFAVFHLTSTGDRLWSMYYGGPGQEVPYGIVRTMGDDYLICGHTESYGAGGWDMWLVKLSNGGMPLWEKTYGGTGGDSAYAVIELQDANIMLVGHTSSFGAAEGDILVLKLTPTGDVIWARRYGTPADERAYSAADAGNGIIIAGTTGSDMLFFKIDYGGGIMWSNAYVLSGTELAQSVIVCSDNRIACAGHTNSFGAGGYDVAVIKFGADGLYDNCVNPVNLNQVSVSVAPMDQSASAAWAPNEESPALSP
ncbi:MAG: hypothetical protein ACP5QG_09465, partial [candidate division WOR-3 bacterium]